MTSPMDTGADAAETPPPVPGWFVDATGRLGYELADARWQLLQVGAQLADQLEPPAAQPLREWAAKLEALSFRIAVVGQAKAGKSSFLNAFTGYPDLLPTGINACTTTVARLHVNHPREDAPGATFRFFTEAEWRHLAEDGGRLKAMSERLGPSFDLDLYRSQLTELRVRARQHLGSDFSELLGKEHRYDWISPSLIASYVSAGQSDAPLPSRESYADITSAADIYLAGEAFAGPITLIDTPGIHDPFRVRDEIMLSSIDDADAYVLVLSARQILSKVDSELLRIVHGLCKDRLVVFINRIDELEDVPRQVPRIVENVRGLLQREFNANIRVLAGSAKWAGAALGSGRRPEDSLAAAKAASHAKAIGAATPKELEELAHCAPDECAEKLGKMLHACSGFSQVYVALADMLRDSAPAGHLHDAAVTFATIARQSEGGARSELNVLEENVRTAHHSVMTDSWELHRLRGQVEKFDGVLGKLDRVYDNRCAALERLRSDAMERLRQELKDAVSDYVERERTAIVFALDRLNSRDGVRFDLSGMRLLLEQAFVARYRKLHGNIVEAEESALQQFQGLIDEEIPRAQLDGPVTASGSFVYPRMAALSRVGVFDIDPKLWSKWRRRHPAVKDAIAEFERILTTEFLDVAGELAEVAEREAGARAAAFVDRLSLTRSNAVATVMKHKAEVQTRLEHMQQALQPQAMERFLGEQIHRLSECRERLLLLVRLGQWLDEFLDRSAAPQQQVQQAV